MARNPMNKFIMFFGFCSLLSCKETSTTQIEKKAAIAVEVVAVGQADIKEYLTFNGVSQYQKKENIRSNVTGYISWMKYKIGDAIRKGDTFATVRTKEQDALKEAVKLDSSLSKFISPLQIQSNATGVISVLNITQDDYVAEGDILATVIQPKSLVIQVNVPYEYEDFVRIGSICEIILQNEASIVAKISAALPTIDPVAQSQTFLIALPDVQLPENLNVQVRTIYKEDKAAMSIPIPALQTNELLTEYWVMKVVGDSMALKQRVKPSLRNDSLVKIEPSAEGLQLHDKVIVNGAYQMQDSTLVSITKK
jgi:multidrug efflux pump subunit AcrA (membrane-fusion protein)